jgi:transposase
MVEAKGCKLEYLPPYSPDFNPIEFSFSVIKKALKRQFQIDPSMSPREFSDQVMRAGLMCITPIIARNQFSFCGYRV